jgi:hypothetical protein
MRLNEHARMTARCQFRIRKNSLVGKVGVAPFLLLQLRMEQLRQPPNTGHAVARSRPLLPVDRAGTGTFGWKVVAVVLMWLALAAPLAAQLVPQPSQVLPMPVGGVLETDPQPAEREEALLCYHQGSTYYVKMPHPATGDVGPLFQRVTPGSAGHMLAFQLRLYNNYPGNLRHEGLITLGVHRRAGQLPGVYEQMVQVAADSIDTGVLDIFLPEPVVFSAGEEFFLSMDYEPATVMDTIAYVTAGLNSYTGHSFFLHNGQISWWGSQDGLPFGDMHFCAYVWLDTQEAYLHFPWTRLDLGRSPAGALQRLALPVLNQGTAPLTLQAAVSGDGWSAMVQGPDSLMPPDTLFLCLDWQAPALEQSGTGTLQLVSNASNMPVRTIPVRAASSTAHLLVADWDEWPWAVDQLGDSSPEAYSWRTLQGLTRPEPFLGHDAPQEDHDCRDVLHLTGLRLAEDARVLLRWSQFRRHSSGMREHRFCWRPTGGEWVMQEQPDLTQDPWLGPVDEWWTTPWLEWLVPADGVYDLGLLYGGPGVYDRWYVDDWELRVEGALAPPQVRVQGTGGCVRLEWDAVPGAADYVVEQVDASVPRVLGATSGTTWTLGRELRRGRGCYVVKARSGQATVEGP